MVFSADAADSELYKKLRVNGSLEKTVSNIKKFKEIQSKHYSKNQKLSQEFPELSLVKNKALRV